MLSGRFVSVEGIDASGKSTVARGLVDALRRDGRPARLLDRAAVPAALSGYPAEHMAALCELIWGYPADAKTSELGFGHWANLLAAWFHGVDQMVVRPALAEGVWLVADSWLYKFAARFALTVGPADATQVFAGVTEPDRVLWLDVAPEVCVRRRAEFRTTEQGEWQGGDRSFVTYQGQVRGVYRDLAEQRGWYRLDAADPAAVLGAARSAAGEMSIHEGDCHG